jgi:hypothetical protein
VQVHHFNGSDDRKRIQDLDRSRKLKLELDEEKNQNVVLSDPNKELQPEKELPF